VIHDEGLLIASFALAMCAFGCATERAVPPADPLGAPREFDSGTFNIRLNNGQGKILAVVVAKKLDDDHYREDWYLSPSGASGNYQEYVWPSSTQATTTLFVEWVNGTTTIPPTNPAPASGAIHWLHQTTKKF
jgi:hypothetical protein